MVLLILFLWKVRIIFRQKSLCLVDCAWWDFPACSFLYVELLALDRATEKSVIKWNKIQVVLWLNATSSYLHACMHLCTSWMANLSHSSDCKAPAWANNKSGINVCERRTQSDVNITKLRFSLHRNVKILKFVSGFLPVKNYDIPT